MKPIKLITITITLLLCFCTNSIAQEHLKFMDISMNTTVDNLQKIFASKGINPDVDHNKALPFGCRSFQGDLFGWDGYYVVYYTKQKKVYEILAFFQPDTDEEATKEYKKLKSELINKFPNGILKQSKLEGIDLNSIFEIDNENGKIIGNIVLSKERDQSHIDNQYFYTVSIKYIDSINYKIKEIENVEER